MVVVVVQRCVGEKLLYEGGRSDRWVLYPLSCWRIIRADKSQRNTLYRGDEAHRWDEGAGFSGWALGSGRSWKLESRTGRRGLEIACRCPITRTDLASPIVAVPTFDLQGWKPACTLLPPSPTPLPPPFTPNGSCYPSVRPIRHCHPAWLLLFRVISLSDNRYVSSVSSVPADRSDCLPFVSNRFNEKIRLWVNKSVRQPVGNLLRRLSLFRSVWL